VPHLKRQIEEVYEMSQ